MTCLEVLINLYIIDLIQRVNLLVHLFSDLSFHVLLQVLVEFCDFLEVLGQVGVLGLVSKELLTELVVGLHVDLQGKVAAF